MNEYFKFNNKIYPILKTIDLNKTITWAANTIQYDEDDCSIYEDDYSFSLTTNSETLLLNLLHQLNIETGFKNLYIRKDSYISNKVFIKHYNNIISGNFVINFVLENKYNIYFEYKISNTIINFKIKLNVKTYEESIKIIKQYFNSHKV